MLSVSVYMLGPIPDSSSGSSLLSVNKTITGIACGNIFACETIVMIEAKMLYGYIPTPACED